VKISSAKVEVRQRRRPEYTELPNLKSNVQQKHWKLPVQPATDHGKQNNPLQDVRSDPQVIPKYAQRRHELPRKIYTLLRQPTTAALIKLYRGTVRSGLTGGGPLGLPSGACGVGNTIGGGPLGLPSVPLPLLAIRLGGTEVVIRNSATANQRGLIFTM
jgi:hypothetical protein